MYLIESRQLWGDYGYNLINATAARKCWETSPPLQISRLGPFVPPLYLCGSKVIVSDRVKRQMEEDRPFDAKFQPVVYEHIHRLDWHEWDLSADDPKRFPNRGEPDDYFWQAMPPLWLPRLVHRYLSRRIARQMEPSWELLLPIIPCDVKWLGTGSKRDCGYSYEISNTDGLHTGLFYSSEKLLYPVVAEDAKQWFEENIKEWVHFEPLRTV